MVLHVMGEDPADFRASSAPEPAAMKVTRVYVTPQIASAWLRDFNKRNRYVRRQHVASLARSMREGRWVETGATIAFDAERQLIDGQHRLLAVIESGCSQHFLVIHGLEPRAFDFTDVDLRPRTAADLLDRRERANKNTLASALRLLWIYRQTGHFAEPAVKPTQQEVAAYEVEEAGIDYSVERAIHFYNRASRSERVPPGLMAALYHLMAQRSPDDAEAFFAGWVQGLGIERTDDPIYVLRRRLADPLMHVNSSRSRDVQAAVFFKAWNAFREGKPIKLLRWNPQVEAFPAPL